jgi:hypothetical protein
VRAQHHACVLGLEEDRVLHRAGRVVLAEVEGVEVEPRRLDLRAFGDLPAHRHEDVVDPLHQGGQRVACPLGVAVVGQRDVDGLLDEHPLLVLGLELLGTPLEGHVHGTAGLTDPLPGLLAGLRWERPDLAVGEGERRPVTRVRQPDLLELGEVGRGSDRSDRLVAARLDLLGVQRRDLDRVVVGVGTGHGLVRSLPLGQERWIRISQV